MKSKLFGIFDIYWKEEMMKSSGGKLRFYRKLKFSVGLEKYLTGIANTKHRHAVTRLRISAHHLPVEQGRYANIPYDSRICTLCKSGEIGDEVHYITACNDIFLSSIRKSFRDELISINRSFISFSNQDLSLYMMSMCDDSISKCVAKFCFNVLEYHKNCNMTG